MRLLILGRWVTKLMGHQSNSFWCLLLTAGALCALAGCADNGPYMTEERLDQGMVMILPGIEGVSQLNKDIREGLSDAGIEWAMPIESWGRPVPLFGMFLNQMDIIGNRIAANSLANDIEEYIDAYPGRPVYLIGHSGGGGMAVFVAEALDDGYMVDGVIVLSGSISSAYNLEKALANTRYGIVNFYNRSDGGLLGAGTTLLGNVDGIRGPGAGLLGFDWPDENDDIARRVAYNHLYQIRLERDMILGGDSHTAVTNPVFVSTFVSPWIYSSSWPAIFNAQSVAYTPTEDELALLAAAQADDDHSPSDPDETPRDDSALAIIDSPNPQAGLSTLSEDTTTFKITRAMLGDNLAVPPAPINTRPNPTDDAHCQAQSPACRD
jgi:pimeloyl-ACP methyl ester carboxylesterase